MSLLKKITESGLMGLGMIKCQNCEGKSHILSQDYDLP